MNVDEDDLTERQTNDKPPPSSKPNRPDWIFAPLKTEKHTPEKSPEPNHSNHDDWPIVFFVTSAMLLVIMLRYYPWLILVVILVLVWLLSPSPPIRNPRP